MTSCISEQLKSKFTRACNSDLTVFSLRRFFSLLHCDGTRENTHSTNTLLTGIEKTLATNFYKNGRESFSEKSFILFVSGLSSLNVSSGIFLSISQLSAIATSESTYFAISFTSLYVTDRFLSSVQATLAGCLSGRYHLSMYSTVESLYKIL